MIRCPKCGTMNRDNSRFCNECGAALQRTKVRCPACGTPNPVSNVFCDACNTRLLPDAKLPPTQAGAQETESPATPLKGISLPARPAAADPADTPDEAELPDWLLELTEESTAPTIPPDEPELAEADLPDWLSGLADAQMPAPEAAKIPDAEAESELSPAELPDWMSGLEQSQASAEHPTAPADLPDWLSDLSGASTSDVAQPREAREVVAEPTEISSPRPEPARDADIESAALPDWLSALQDEVIESDIAGTGEDQAEQSVEESTEGELPDWLSGFAGETAEEEEADLPDWLAGVGVAQALEGKEEEADVAPIDLPDWMSEADVEPEAQADVAPTDLPDWMSEADVQVEPEAPAASPTFFEEPPTYVMDTEESWDEAEFQPQSALPDWLLVFADTEADYAPSGPQELPSWLLANADQDAMPSSASPSELPAWLLKYAEAAASVESERAPRVSTPPDIETPAEIAELEEEEAPDWLSDLAEERAEEAEIFAEQAPAPAAAPDWLSSMLEEEVPEEEIATEPQAAIEAAAEDLPDWLADLQQEEEPQVDETLAIEEELTTGDMPDWLADIVSEESEAETARPEHPAMEEAKVPDWMSGSGDVSISETPESAESLEELPDWLSGIGEAEEHAEVEEPPPSEDLPDWLREGKAEAAPPAPEPAEELPDWLTGVADAGGAPAAAVFTEGVPEEAPEPAAPDEDSAPDWLPDMAGTGDLQPAAPAFVPEAIEPSDAPSQATSATDIPEGIADEAVPDWLSELRPGALEESSPPVELPVDETLARAEVPLWLRGLKPPGTGPLPQLPDEAGGPDFDIPSEEESGLARAEIPDWVQALKATVRAEPQQDLYQQPAEEQGPLAGLPGMLPPHAAVDVPPDYQVPPRPTLPDALVQQAQLWQQLLEQPRGKARPVAQAQKQQQTISIATRLLVAVLFIAIAALGLFVPGQFWANVAPTSRPGVIKLHGAIAALQPGDTVILAVEYGTAEAAEMDMMANTLMAHLADREVNIIAVSTLPEGVGLAYELLEAQNMQNQLPEDSSPYLPGSYNGVAGFLSTYQQGQNISFLLILSSRVDRLTWWIEQNLTFSQPYPMGVLGTAAVGSRMSPYLNTRGTDGWLTGVTDMVLYRKQQGATLRLVDRTFGLENILNALMFTHWIALVLIILGVLYTLVTGRKRTK